MKVPTKMGTLVVMCCGYPNKKKTSKMECLSYQIKVLEHLAMNWGRYWEVLDGQQSNEDRTIGLKCL